jgi:ferredoxin-NADP reductase
VSTGSHAAWQTGRVVETRPLTDDVRQITIVRPPRGRAAAGSHLDIRVPLGEVTDTRSYSIVESDDAGGRLTISVLRVPQSRGGSAYMHRLAVGDTVEVTQPLQDFPLRIGAPRYVLLAGGIGVTALRETARVLQSVRADYTFVYVGRGRDRMAYLEELEQAHGDRLVVHVDDEGTPLDVGSLVRSVADHADAADSELYLCGPIRLMDAVRREWGSAGLPATNLRFETFGNSGWYRPEPFTVRIAQLGVETTVGAGESILQALTRAGADLMYDCRKGQCGLCRIEVDSLDGTLDHRDVFLSEDEKSSNRSVCVCVSRVVGGEADSPVLSLTLP